MMKNKNPYITLVALSMLVILVYSCRKEFLADETLNPKVEWAKDYFKETLLPNEGNIVDPYQYVANTLQANLLSKKKENHKIPIWQKATEGKTEDYAFVEVPLKYTTKVTPMLSHRGIDQNFASIADKSILQASLDRLIIFKKKNGKIDQRIISFIPTKAYLDRHNGDISHNKINKLDKDFEGLLIYRKWNGMFESALIVKNGKGIKRILLNTLKPLVKKAQSQDEDCGTFDVWEWFVDCTYSGDDPNPKDCGEPYKVKIGQVEIPCEDDPYDPCLEPENFEMCNPGEEEAPTDIELDDDGCPTSKTAAAAKVNAMVANNTSIANAVASVLGSSNNNKEAAFRVDDNAGTITASPPVEEEELQSSTSTNSNTIAIGHDHPANGFPQPSPFDFYQAGNLAIQSNGKLATDYTFSPSASYAIVITNTTLFSQFLTNYPMSSTLAKDQNGNYTGEWKRDDGGIGDELYVAFGRAYLADPRSNGTVAEQAAAEITANEYAMARLMNYTAGGATLLKKDSNGNWKALHYTKQTINGITSYTVTPCN